tara:strand:+ start:11306 stop:11575 length:270 start_codon:yes stop_codon:yes gene_type:complete
MDFNKMTRDFLMGEGRAPTTTMARFRAIREAIESLAPRTIKERQRIEIAKENLAHARRTCRKLEEQNNALLEENNQLTEKLQLLEEDKG